jgi:hypothetical protein
MQVKIRRKNSKQIIWKCATVLIFNKSKFDSGGNKEETEFWQCLLPFGPELSIFSSAIEKHKH